jgi:peptide/nickel transport system permease protein
MWIFFLRRLLMLPPLLLVISILTYGLLQLAPGDFYSRMEQDQKYSYDHVMEMRKSVGRVVEIDAKDRATDLHEFTVGDRRYSFDAEGRLLKAADAAGPELEKKWEPADPKLEQTWVKRFQWPPESGTRWVVSEAGRVYRYVGALRGYLHWLGNVLQGDFGKSWSQSSDVGKVMRERMMATLTLEILALSIAWGLAIPLGVWSGVKPNSLVDHVCGAFAYMSLSIPGVFLSLLALLFALETKLFPVGNMRSTTWEELSAWGQFTDRLWHLVLPASVIGLTSVAIYMRQMRGQMVETMSSDYVRTARAKGVPRRRVLFVHALRNAINPLVTLFGFSIASLLSGSFLVEYVFNWPGLARVTVDAVFAKDEPLVMASVLFAALLLVAGNIVADVLLAIVDPKIRLE